PAPHRVPRRGDRDLRWPHRGVHRRRRRGGRAARHHPRRRPPHRGDDRRRTRVRQDAFPNCRPCGVLGRPRPRQSRECRQTPEWPYPLCQPHPAPGPRGECSRCRLQTRLLPRRPVPAPGQAPRGQEGHRRRRPQPPRHRLPRAARRPVVPRTRQRLLRPPECPAPHPLPHAAARGARIRGHPHEIGGLRRAPTPIYVGSASTSAPPAPASAIPLPTARPSGNEAASPPPRAPCRARPSSRVPPRPRRGVDPPPPRRRRPQPVSSTAGGTSPPMRARRGDWSVRRASTSPYGGLGVRRRGGVFLPPPGKAKPAKVLLMLLFDAYHRRGATVARGPL